MAGYECALCAGAEQATLLITPLTGGETMAVGPDCMGTALVGMTAGHFELDADKLLSAVERLLKARDKDAAKHTGAGDAGGQADEPEFPEGPSGSGADDLAAIEAAQLAAQQGPGGPQSPPEPPAAPPEGGKVTQLPGRRPRHSADAS